MVTSLPTPVSHRRPRSLWDDSGSSPITALSRAECDTIAQHIVKAGTRGGDTGIFLRSIAVGNVRWARNEIISAGETYEYMLRITRTVRGQTGMAQCNRISADAIASCIERAEWAATFSYPTLDPIPLAPQPSYDTPTLWSAATAALGPAERAEAIRKIVDPSVSEHLVSAGYLEVSGYANYLFNTAGRVAYQNETRTNYSTTVRTVDGTGSSWAGMSHFDWARIDAPALARRALEGARKSASPKGIEPGIYDAILQPQAVADLVRTIISANDRADAERQYHVFSEPPDTTRIGKRVLDVRLNLSQDPMHPDAGMVPFDPGGEPIHRTTWIENGMLQRLAYDRKYAVQTLGEAEPLLNSQSGIVQGGTATVDDMIASTKRGLLVTRLWGNTVLDRQTLMMTGTTRDGLWLIEDGKVTTAAKNFRYNESPIFAFNNVEQVGVSVRTHGYPPLFVPPIKVRDFHFTSLSDAV